MKIICIGRNYADHARELKNDLPTEPVIFLKPETAVIKDNAPFYYPDFSQDIHHEVELLVKINKEGKNIQEKFAHKYYSEIGIGIDFTARDLQNMLKAKGLPWEVAKAFNGSAAISSFLPKADVGDLQHLHISLNINGTNMQSGNTSDMIFSIDYMIGYMSRFFTLKKGDIIFTGTPAGVGPVKVGDHVECFLEGKKLLSCHIR